MADEKLLNNQIISHKILNYLNSAFQGIFTFQNILKQLNSQNFSEETLNRTKEKLAKIKQWNISLLSGKTFFDTSLGKQQSPDVLNARALLKELIPTLLQTSQVIIRILSDREYFKNEEAVFYLIAVNGQACYAKDNYLRGIIEFSQAFNLLDVVKSTEAELSQFQEEFKSVNTKISIVKNSAELTPPVYTDIYYLSRILPGNFRAQVHDIYQLLNLGLNDFTYEAAKIDANSARIWERLEISPIEAGYWNAYGFTTDTAPLWRNEGFFDPVVACSWSTLGFDAKTAMDWLAAAIPPLLAISWRNAGYEPEEAAEAIQSGTTFPQEEKKERY